MFIGSTVLTTPFCRLDLATSMGGGLGLNNGNYAPIPHCGARDGNSNGRIVCYCLVRLAMKLVVAQFCMALDYQ